ncbi:MAG: hypothetical protein D6820_00125 [Lentisphaerae bacterium]|nr:MAG: hypothetical protein D6820_00125 [Lentisphaerota bacterium]
MESMLSGKIRMRIVRSLDYWLLGHGLLIWWVFASVDDLCWSGALRFWYLLALGVSWGGIWLLPVDWLRDRIGRRLVGSLRLCAVCAMGLAPFLGFWSRYPGSTYLWLHVVGWLAASFVGSALLLQYCTRVARSIPNSSRWVSEFMFGQRLLIIMGLGGGGGGLHALACLTAFQTGHPFVWTVARFCGLATVVMNDPLRLTYSWVFAVVWSFFLGSVTYSLILVLRYRCSLANSLEEEVTAAAATGSEQSEN